LIISIPEILQPVFTGKYRYRGAYGGRGSGKSLSFALMCLVRGIEKRQRILCAREIQSTIRDSVHRELADAVSEFGLEQFYNIGVSFIKGINGTEFIFKGLRHNYREIKSTSNIDICWVEEAEAVSEDSWRVLIPTIRNDKSEIWLTWNPEHSESPTNERFINNPPNNSCIVRVNYNHNPFFPKVLEEERQNDLRRYDKRVYEHVWLGKYLDQTGFEIYYNFDPKLHVSDVAEYEPSLPILWSLDFNIAEGKPMSSCLCQIKDGVYRGEHRKELHVFDEIVIETADTNQIVDEMDSKFVIDKSNFIVYGDASGRSKDTRSKTTDFQILMRRGYSRQRIPRSNPPIRERHNAVNAILKNAIDDVRFKIHPRCQVLIKGLQSVTLKPNAGYIELETYEQHITTALGYLVAMEFSLLRNVMSFKR